MAGELRKVLCSIGVGAHADLMALARPMYETYARLHGYDLVLVEQPMVLDRPAAWHKVLLIRQLMDRYNLIVWIDSDAMIVDPTVDIANAISRDHFLWIVEHHVPGLELPLINSGVMAIWTSPQAVLFFEEVWGMTEFIYHPWWEQAAMMSLLGYDPCLFALGSEYQVHTTEWFGEMGRLSTEWNSMNEDPHPSPRIVHFPGMPFRERLEKMVTQLHLFNASFGQICTVPSEAPLSTSRQGVSVVLSLVKGPPEPMLASLAALSSFGLSNEDEVILVDDGSELGGVLAAVGGAKIIRCAQPFGLLHAWQEGWRAASGDVVVLMAAPVRLFPGCLDGLVEMLHDEGVGVAIATEIGQSSGQHSLLGPGAANVLAARRRDLLNIEPAVAGSIGQEASALLFELTSGGRRAARSTTSFVYPPLSMAGSSRSTPCPESASGAVPWCRWTYSRSLSAVPCREELPFVLNARGLKGTAVEVGVLRGLFSAHILTHWEGQKLISVDPWIEQDKDVYMDTANQPQEVQDNIYREVVDLLGIYGSRSEIWRMTSREAAVLIADNSLDFVYIDARHDYESVMEDLESWFPKVRSGGVIAGHGYLDGDLPEGRFGVRRAVREFFAAQGLVVCATTSDPPWLSWLVEKG